MIKDIDFEQIEQRLIANKDLAIVAAGLQARALRLQADALQTLAMTFSYEGDRYSNPLIGISAAISDI